MQIEFFSTGPIQANCIFVWDSKTKEALIFDPGDEDPRILKFVKDKELDVKGIVLTHGHFDHCFGAWYVKKALGANVMMYKADELVLKRNLDLASSWMLPTPKEYETHADVDIVDGQCIRFGEYKFKVIHTPGHSPGSCCFYEESQKVVISGDTLFNGGIGRTDLPGGSASELRKSIEKLHSLLGPEGTHITVYCGHGKTTNASPGAFGLWRSMV